MCWCPVNMEKHIEYTCSKLSKCTGIFLKVRKWLNKGVLVSSYYSFAYPYFIYCNHVWGNTYASNLERMVLMQKRLVRVITCSHYRAHREPLMLANRLISLQDINLYVFGIFMHNYMTQKLRHISENYFQQNKDVHELNTRQANDFHVPFSRLQVRRFSIKIHGTEVWNSFPTYILNLDILQGSFRLSNLFSLRRLESWINHLPPACWSTFWKSIFKHRLGCRFDILNSISSFSCILTYAIIYVLIHHIIFWLYLYFLIILCFFKYSCTNIFHRRSLCTFYTLRYQRL